MRCRHCGSRLEHPFLDLGCAPPSNAYLRKDDLGKPEVYYPLKLHVCPHCWLVQTQDYARAEELFPPDYAYFSSTSSSWLSHAKEYFESITTRLRLGAKSFVVEVASNDGYLLRNFVEAGIPCLGIEPTASTAGAAETLGIPVMREFFGEAIGEQLAAEGRRADLIVGNNVFAHVPDINDFTRGLKGALAPTGTITLEFPHLLRLIDQVQFDTVYHEHFSYLSLYTVSRIFEEGGLRVFDVEDLSTHGGSLRVYGCHKDDRRLAAASVNEHLSEEERAGLRSLATYQSFQARADCLKDDLLFFLMTQKREGRRVAGYGAAAKGNTLLNYAGVRSDLISFVADKAPSKQGRYLPGSRIPVVAVEVLCSNCPDAVLILPWNLVSEVTRELRPRLSPSTKFVTAVPRIQMH